MYETSASQNAPNDRFDVISYERHYHDGACILKEGDNIVCLSETDEAYIKQVYPPDPKTVATQTSYYPDTLTVSGKGQFLKDWNIEIGVWKTYDRYGEVLEEIDKDKHYPVSWDEMRAHFLENDIRINDIRIIRRTQNPNTGQYLWTLILNAPCGILDMACFDAATGDLIERKQTSVRCE